MTTLPIASNGSITPHEGNVSKGDFAFACSRFQHQVHNLLARVVKDSGLSQKELSRITKIDEATISRLLSRPRNIETDTLSRLVYGASQAFLTVSLARPSNEQRIMLVSCSEEKRNISTYYSERLLDMSESNLKEASAYGMQMKRSSARIYLQNEAARARS